MLDLDTRTAILRLAAEKHGFRPIARMLGISRQAVRDVVNGGVAEVPKLARTEFAADHLGRIQELYVACEGNLALVHETLGKRGFAIAYSTLTAFCRRHGIGVVVKVPSGRYHYRPGEEMQHDTSPHDVVIAGVRRRVQCASVVLCHSRMLFAQVYPTFNRFYCKVFLTDGVVYFGGAASRCMVDNTNVVVARGTGCDAIIAPEMVAFGKRFDFVFVAHEVGDANRSARVERPFHYIEHNFYPNRTFTDFDDLNRQLRAWCVERNARVRTEDRIVPISLLAHEITVLRRVPAHVPEVYALHERIVDVEGYVNLHANRYSVPVSHLSQRVDVRESKDRVRIFVRHQQIAEHVRREEGTRARVTLDTHQDGARWKHAHAARVSLPEETRLRGASPELAAWIDALHARGGRTTRAVRAMHRMWMDYELAPLVRAVTLATDHGLFDVERIETMVLRDLAGDFFRIPDGPVDAPSDAEDDDGDEG